MRVNDIVTLLNEHAIKHKGFEMKCNVVFRILTNRKYIGEYKFGAMITGVIGTSHTSSQYRYYKYNQSKQGKCDKKTTKKEWLEEHSDRIYELQLREDNTATTIQAQLTVIQTKLNNLLEAITQASILPR